MKDYFSLESYLYNLPEDLIAQYPCAPRDRSKLMIVDRKTGRMEDHTFHDLVDILQHGDSIVFNNTKVLPARLIGSRLSGGKTEVFLVNKLPNGDWEALVKPGKKLPIGTKVIFGDGFSCEIIDVLLDGNRIVHFDCIGNFEEALHRFGQTPLPPYMKREVSPTLDNVSYQTVYAQHPGSVAAPTAGLHFTDEMIEKLNRKGILQDTVTLHVGLGTFLPVKSPDIRDHTMHKERFFISDETAHHLNHRSQNHLQICVGTTTCRTLESATHNGIITPGSHDTNIFIHPGYQFKYVKSLLTNFHQPGSSLLMLVSAFASYELIMEAYSKAIKDRYRFLSYGDSMLLL